ncbi:hypothetical protein LWI29_033710 [Acer saccharum]|uniref:Glutaredoxin domain-containing protein n=1 Tax=Acer saccharum TaxID=4024 RepID=A0AA39VNE3_ACESA|nr:hypothetical protein LWI29_033710 [Acer saccharum]
MGCANSKQKRCRNCQSPYSPVPRSYSMHVHHPPQGKNDSYHVVALQSTTLGSLKLDFKSQNQSNGDFADHDHVDQDHDRCFDGDKEDNSFKEEDFNIGLMEAKVWSNMIEQKIPKIVPKTPIRTPPGEPETINTWELMEGLEDVSPHRLSPKHFRSFSFGVVRNVNNTYPNPNPVIDKSIVSEFDPEVISSFRKSFEELSPGHPFHLRPLDSDDKKSNGVVLDHKLCKEKLVVYFTSLRGVRKTYEDCCNVRVILKGLCVRIDERDVSMHSGFKDELKELLGDGFNKGGLPKVFVGSNYIGGAEEIRRLHEEGQLEKLVENCEIVDDSCGGGGNAGACQACGDMRFVPCETCSGSCKIYYQEEEEEEWEGEESDFGFQRCPDCNENGLIRCPICCY